MVRLVTLITLLIQDIALPGHSFIGCFSTFNSLLYPSHVLLQVVTIYSIASTRFITCIALQRYTILTPGQSRHADYIDIDSLQCVSDSVALSLVHTQHQHQRPTYTSIHGFRSCTTLVC